MSDAPAADPSRPPASPRFRELPRIDPHGLYHPADEREIRTLVAFARARALTVRVRGAGHSVPAAIHTDARLRGERHGDSAIEMVLDRMTAVEFHDARREVTVGAGCRLGRDPRDPEGRTPGTEGLCAQLERRGWALPNLGGVNHQTVAGFLATGSAGGSTQHDLGACVVAVRLVDGRGQIHTIDREDARLPAVVVSMGLCGIITSVTLACEPRYDVAGDERVILGIGPELDVFSDGSAGLAALLEREEYARLLWWPQAGVGRFAVWRARRMAPGDYGPSTGERGALRPLRYAPMEPIAGSTRVAQVAAGLALGALGSWRHGLRRALGDRAGAAVVGLAEQAGARSAEAALIRSFVPLDSARPFRDAWHRALPMDDPMEDALLPTSFTELWVPLERAGEAMRRLRVLHASDPAVAGHFATELYAAPRSRFWLSPGHPGPALRINAFWYDRNPGDPRRDVFPHLWSTFADMGYRLHWGKALPLDATASARHLARQYPRWDDFHRVRAALDPEGVFLTRYWREHLGIDAADTTLAVTPLRRDTFLREPPSLHRRWPLAFALLDADEAMLEDAERRFEVQAQVSAPPEAVFDLVRDIPRSGEWFPTFVHQEPRTPAQGAGTVYDETFGFMTARMRVLRESRGGTCVWAAVVEACSLPLASRMVMFARFEPDPEGTRVRWTVAYDPLPRIRALDPVLRPAFEALFQRAVDNLARHFRGAQR